MAWQALCWQWFVHAGFTSLTLLSLANLALVWIRQPARQLRLIEWTLIACLAAPFLHFLPGMPSVSLGWMTVGATKSKTRLEMIEMASQSGAAAIDGTAPIHAAEPQTRSVSSLAESRIVPSPRSAAHWRQACLTIYALGAFAVLLHWFAGIASLRRLQRSATPAPPQVRRLLLGIGGAAAQRVLLATSRDVDTPITFGWRRPVIVLPERLHCKEGEEALRYALAHEWSHVERRDVVFWHLSALLQVLFFYQPLFWRLRRQLRLCQDYLADARAAEQGAMVEDYADYLVSVALRRLKAPPLPALTFGHRRSLLFQRVMMLVERRDPLERRCCGSWSWMLCGSALLLAFAVSTLRLDAEEATHRAWGKPLAPSAAANYHGWVYDDETGRPLEGAMVIVRRRDAGAAEDRVLQESLHVTDAAGHYSFALLPEHLANVWLFLEFDVGHPQYASKAGISCSLDSARQMDAFGGQSAVGLIRLRRGEETTGIVESAEGRPAAGVTVVAYSQADALAGNSGSFSRTKTDAEGHFRILLTASSDGVLCVQSPDGLPLVFLIRQQRGDLGRLQLPISVAQQDSSHDVVQVNSPQGAVATLARSR